jgi:hypothetical protein
LSSNLTLEKAMIMVNKSDGEGALTMICETYEFSGSIIEVMGQFVDHHFESFCFLLNNCTGFYNPSTTLLHFIGRHEVYSGKHSPCDNGSNCPVRTLLEAGADPNLVGYRVTPLQMAVVAWDVEGVRMLLEFGANPNGPGDTDGVVWRDRSAHARFNHLHGKAPLQICRSRECLFSDKDYMRVVREPAFKTIEQLLLQFGAAELIKEVNKT